MLSAGVFTYRNNEYNYKLIKSSVFIEEYGYTAVYGIRIYNEDGSEFSSVEDISDDFESVDRLCRLMCNENICPVHLIDIVEDFISGQYDL